MNHMKFIYILFEYLAILQLGVTLAFGILQFFTGIGKFFLEGDMPSGHERFDFELLIRNFLTAFEIFFLAPLPILIVASVKPLIFRLYPQTAKATVLSRFGDMITEIDAKKTFISSLIGVTSTFFLGQLIDRLTMQRVTAQLSLTEFLLVGVFVILFLVMQITLYSIIASHSTHAASKQAEIEQKEDHS